MDDLAIALRLADAASEAWAGIRDQPGLDDVVGMGADGTETSHADKVLDEAVLAAAADLGVDVLSEEAGFVDHGGGRLAVVDPLDGSRNAGRGIPIHCTSVAVGEYDLPGLRAGVVRNLPTGDTYVAVRGRGASVNGTPVQPRAFDPDEVMVAVIADSSVDEVQQEQERRGHHLRDLGTAALELCLVGTGALDAFVVRRPWLRVIDIAAGAVFVEEAGGRVLEPDTGARLATPLNLDIRTGLVAVHSDDVLEAVG